MTKWGSPVEIERHRRIRVALAAYAYEFESNPIIDDGTFDKLCREITPSMVTGNKLMDKWFRTEFNSSTGSWIHDHPELKKIISIYKKYWG